MQNHDETGLSSDGDESERARSPRADESIPPAAAERVQTDRAAPAWVPDWAPWAVLGGLACLGLFGGLGLVPLHLAKAKEASAATSIASAPATSPAPVAPAARRRPPGLAEAPNSWAEAKAGPKISVLELVVTYKGTALATHQHVERTQAEARARALEALARAKQGEDFDQLIAKYSDEPETTPHRGHLDGFARGQAIASFADAAFALEPGELSEPVLTPFGYHVILRTK